jgi:hypothetical protein
MLKRLLATVLAIAMPVSTWAGERPAPADSAGPTPIRAAIDRAGREIGAVERDEGQSRSRFWSGIALIAGGGVLTTLGAVELGDDEAGPDDGEDINGSDDGEDEDGWGNKAMIGGGIAAAALGSVLLMTGKSHGPSVSVKRGGFVVRQTVRF